MIEKGKDDRSTKILMCKIKMIFSYMPVFYIKYYEVINAGKFCASELFIFSYIMIKICPQTLR